MTWSSSLCLQTTAIRDEYLTIFQDKINTLLVNSLSTNIDQYFRWITDSCSYVGSTSVATFLIISSTSVRNEDHEYRRPKIVNI